MIYIKKEKAGLVTGILIMKVYKFNQTRLETIGMFSAWIIRNTNLSHHRSVAQNAGARKMLTFVRNLVVEVIRRCMH